MSEIKPVERFTFSVEHETAYQDEQGLWVKFPAYEALQKENAEQAKRIEELEEANGLLQTQVHCLEMVAASKDE